MNGYANNDVLVSTDWLERNIAAPGISIVEVNEDVLLYDTGHVPGAVKLDWHTELQRQDVRDFIGAAEFAELAAGKGISTGDTVVLYGDKSNWWAAYAFWFFKYNGHADVRLVNGGRQKWVAEGRPLTTDLPQVKQGEYRVPYRDASIRAFAPDVLQHIIRVNSGEGALVDVRSVQEFTGEKLHMPDYPNEGALRGGHVPGASSIPWAQAVTEEGTFRPADELRELYALQGVTPDKDVIAYCRIAERSSHSWFVLKYLLGFPNVRNYDGSWTEWGARDDAEVES